MQTQERRQAIIVLDFGSQYSRLITRRVRELHVYSELVPATTTLAQLQEQPHLDIRGFILSGGPASVYDEQAPLCDPAILTSGLPVLGICYGMQLLAHQLGGHVAPGSGRREGLRADLRVDREAAPGRGEERAAGDGLSGPRLRRAPPPRARPHPPSGDLGRRRLQQITQWLVDVNVGLKGGNPLPPRLQVERLIVRLAKSRT